MILRKTFAALLRQPSRLLTILFLLFGFAVGMAFRHWSNAAQNTRKPLAQQQLHALTGALGEAVSAAQYNLNEVETANGEKSLEAVNPAQGMRASFTSQEIQVHSGSACQTPWQLGLQLKRVGYGTQLRDVRPGVLSAQGHRVEIQRDTITEWYLNKPEGIEQGFTLNARPTTAPPSSGELRVVMELSNGWKATPERDQQAITLQQGSASLRYDKLHTLDATGRELASRMEVSGNELALVVNDTSAVWPITIDPTLTQQTQFVASNGAGFDHFGAAVAISEDTAVVGVPDSDPNSTTNAGAVYVFVRTGSTWSQQAQLTASDAASNDNFGAAVAISGDTIVVGAYGDDNGFNSDQGSAYVFVRSGTTWSQQAKLTVGDGAANDWFGYAVAVSGDTVMIGAPLDDFGSTVNQGSAYVFVRSGVAWSQQQQLNATDTADSDNFGFAVALQGGTSVIGAPADDVSGSSDQGSACVFVRSNTTWSQQQQLIASDGASGDLLGYAVAISGETVTIGAPRDDNGGNVDQGSAYVFVRSSTTWSQQTKLMSSDGADGDTFGNAIAISGDMVVVGAPTNDVGGNADQGSAYVFVRSGATWSQQQQAQASDGTGNDNAGSAVAISGFTALVGTPNDDVNGNTDQGLTYVFSPTCPTMTLSPTMLSNGTQNLLYPTTTIASSAGTAPLTYTIISGALPAGLTLTSGGTLSGTPTVAGNFNFTVKVTDANLCTGTRAYSLAIATCAPPVVSTEPTNQSSAVGSSASFTAAASGTPPTVQWQVSTDGNTWSNLNGATNATLNLTNLTITMHGNKYRAVFTNACGTATSNAATLTVNKLTPTVTLNLSATSVTYGQSVTLTANVNTINATAPTGSITFKSGATTIGTGTIANGQSAVSLSSLNAAAHSITAEFSGDTNYVAITSGASVLTINKATLTVTAENKTKIYGAANPALTATITGFVNSESASVVTGAAAITTTATTGSAVGEYAITAAAGTLAAANYNLTFVSATLTIGKATLTVTADNKSRIYGATNPALMATITGFVNGETESALSGTLQLSTTASAGSSVGDYSISVSGFTSTNYAINFVNGTLTIGKAVLTVTAENKARRYGAANPDLTASLTGFVNNETASVVSGVAAITTTAAAGSAVGEYPITVALGTLAAANYDFTLAHAKLTIGKAMLTVTAGNKARTYGTQNPELTATITGFVNGDTISAVTGAPALTTTATVNSGFGTYPITTALGTLAATNYDFTLVNGTLTVAAQTLIVTAQDKSRIYGAANPLLTVQYAGFVNGDTESVLTGAAEITTTATTDSNVGAYPITVRQGSLQAGNYALVFVDGTLTIGKAALTVAANDAMRSYGFVNPTLTGMLTGVQNNDRITAAYLTTATINSAVNMYPIAPTLNDPDSKLGNYQVTQTNGTLAITPAALTITAENKSRIYGAANPALTARITGFVNGETESALSGTLQLSTTASASSSVGDYPISISGFTSANYTINFVNGTLTISKAVLTVTAENKTKLFGAANPDLTASLTGFVNNETASVVSGAAALTTTATQSSGAGSYPITVALGTLAAANYEFTFASGTLTIGKTALTVTAANKTKVFGAVVPELTHSITGFLNGDGATVVTGSPTTTTTATAISNVGSYPITLSLGTLSAASYDFNFVNAELTIASAATAVTLVSNVPSSLFGQAVTFTAIVHAVAPGAGTPNGTITFKDGAKSLGTVTLTNGQAALTTSALETGTHSLTAEYSGAENFTAAVSPAVPQSISKSSATVTLASSFDAVRYGQAATFNVAVSGGSTTPTGNVRLLNGSTTLGTVALVNGAASLTTNGLPVAMHTITAVYDGDAKNDSGTSRSFILTVNKAAQPVNTSASANPVAWKQFVTLAASVNSAGNGLVAPTGTVVFKDGATVLGTSALSRLGRASISTNALSPGAHSITAEFSGDGNYEANTAAAMAQSISKGATAIRFTSSAKTTTSGQSVIFSAQLHSNAGTPMGQVELYDGTQLLNTETLSGGWVTWTMPSLPDGNHSLTAVYKGDEQFATSTSAALLHTVSPFCTWTLATTNAAFDLSGGTGFILVDGRSDCFWDAFTNDRWITILDYGPEVGALSFRVDPLTTGTARKGTITVAGQRVTILQTKPVVTVSGASYTREGLAPDAIASVFGEGLAPATEPSQALPLPTTLGGVQVKITDSNGTEHTAPLFYVAPLQINYLIPSEVALGPALVTIQTPAGDITGGGMIEVTPITPGLFTANSNGSGVAAAVVQRVLVDGSQRYEQIGRFDPTQNKVVSVPIDFGEEGEDVYLVLFGTGLRSRLALATVRATMSDQDIEILYAGTQGGYVGLDQLNLKLPRTLAGKGEVDLKLYVEGKPANTVRINLK